MPTELATCTIISLAVLAALSSWLYPEHPCLYPEPTAQSALPAPSLPSATKGVFDTSAPSLCKCHQHDVLLSVTASGVSNIPRDESNAVLPSQAGTSQLIRLPGQTRVSPEEYKEFLGLGHGDVFDLDPDRC